MLCQSFLLNNTYGTVSIDGRLGEQQVQHSTAQSVSACPKDPTVPKPTVMSYMAVTTSGDVSSQEHHAYEKSNVALPSATSIDLRNERLRQ